MARATDAHGMRHRPLWGPPGTILGEQVAEPLKVASLRNSKLNQPTRTANFMTKKTQPKRLSIRKLATATGLDRSTITRRLEGRTPRSQKEALLIIEGNPRSGAPGADPKTGLSWSAAAKRETALRLRRENEEATAIQERIWFPTATMLDILRAVVTRLEGFPAKVRSEAGLSESQVATVQRNVDDLRGLIASDIAGLGTPEKGGA